MGRVVFGRVVLSPDVRSKSVSPEVLDQEQSACIISLIFLIFLKHNPKTSLKSFRVKKNNSTIFHSRFHLFLCFVISEIR